MRLASGWRGTIWHVFSPYLHGTFPQNSSILTVDNPVKKSLSLAVDALISNLSQTKVTHREGIQISIVTTTTVIDLKSYQYRKWS